MKPLTRRFLLALLTIVGACLPGASVAGNVAEAWRNTYPGPVSGSFIASDSAGNVLVAVSVPLADGHWKTYAVKYSRVNGTVSWEKLFNVANAVDTVPYAIAADADGNAILACTVNTAAGSDIHLVKLAAASGEALWERRYDGPAHHNDGVWDVAVDTQGNVAVTGYSDDAANKSDAFTARYAASNGGILWERTFDGEAHGSDSMYSVAVDAGGNVAVTGKSSNGTDDDALTIKYDANTGNVLWKQTHAGVPTGADCGIATACDSSGAVLVAVSSETQTEDGPTCSYIAKYAAANGALIWEKTVLGAGDASPFGIAVDAANNVLMTGCTTVAGRIDLDYHTVKFAAGNGSIVWEKTYDGTGQAHDQSFAIALDAGGNAVVVGESENATNPAHPDICTIKYASANGTVLWEKRFNGAGDLDDRVGLTAGKNKVVAMTDGGAAITGITYSPQTQNTVTVRYVPDDLTQTPLLIAPAASSFNKNPLTISYSLPEAALSGSVKLLFDDGLEPRVLVLAAGGETAGEHTLTIDPAHPALNLAVASGPPLPDRVYDITLSYQDGVGNPLAAASSVGVTLDTLPPEVLVPNYPTIHTGDTAGVAYDFDIIAYDLFDPSPEVITDPLPGSVFPIGFTNVNITAKDRSGNIRTADFGVDVILVSNLSKPTTTIVAAKGGIVPSSAAGVPAGSKWLTFGIPSLHNGGASIGFSATVRTPDGTLTGVFDGPADAPYLLLKQGSAVLQNTEGKPMPGVTVDSFKTPVFPSTGEDFAGGVIAKLRGLVTTANDSAILLTFPGDPPVVIAQEGSPAPNTHIGENTEPVGTFKSFTSLAMPGNSGAIWFTATLARAGGITSENDSGLWIRTSTDGTRLLLREGSPIPGIRDQAVTGIRALEPVAGSAGHGRYGSGFVGVHVTLADGTESVFNIDVNGGIENDIATGVPLNPTGVSLAGLGVPNWRQTTNVPVVLLATLAGPGVTATNNRAIVDYPKFIARKASPTGLSDGSSFKNFKDPVATVDQDGFPVDAFLATLTGGTTTSVNDSTIFWWHGPAPALNILAREGGPAPGGGRWASFNSLAAIDRRGPAFTATLALDGIAITTSNDDGLWATNSAGALKPLFREGDTIQQRKLSSFNVLGVVNGSPGQRRAWAEGGQPAIIWRGFFTDGSSAILRTTIP